MQKRKTIREGLYWQALELPPDTNMGKIDLRVFDYMQEANGDHEFKQMLNNLRRHFSNNSYGKVYMEFWAKLSTELDDNHVQAVLEITQEKDISRETVWGKQIEPMLDLPNNSIPEQVKSNLFEHFRGAGFELAKNGQKPPDEANNADNYTKAIKALKKSIYCMDIAHDYANNIIKIEYIERLRNQAKEIEQGIEIEALIKGYAIPEWPEDTGASKYTGKPARYPEEAEYFNRHNAYI